MRVGASRVWERLGLLTVVSWLGVSTLQAAEVTLDRGYLSGVVEQLPEVPFAKAGQYRGAARRFRLVGIDPASRELIVACAVAGEFRPPMAAALDGKRPRDDTDGWKAFAFDVKAGIRVEAGRDGLPRFRVDVEEVKRRELEGVAGLLAKLLGRSFDTIVTQVADGKADDLNRKLNAQLMKRLAAFQQYGVLRAIDYDREAVRLHFDVTRLKREGVAGYVYPEPRPGTVPLQRYVRPGIGDHYYEAASGPRDVPGYVYEGAAGHVPGGPGPGSLPFWRWRGRREGFYTTVADGEGAGRGGFRREGLAGYVVAEPTEGAVPLYRFVDPRTGLHFYTTHPHAEFAK